MSNRRPLACHTVFRLNLVLPNLPLVVVPGNKDKERIFACTSAFIFRNTNIRDIISPPLDDGLVAKLFLRKKLLTSINAELPGTSI